MVPKFDGVSGEDEGSLQNTLNIDNYLVSYNDPIRIEIEDRPNRKNTELYSSESSDDEFDLDQEEGEGGFNELDQDFLLDGAGQETIEALQDIERMAEKN